jgi:ubiquinol-cytochrome c reductase cytochrome c1 subunit
MPPPLTKDSVTFSDGTPSTVEQEAHDIVTFLSWASEPRMEERKKTGLVVMAFLVAFAGLLYLSYRKIWRDAH